MEIIDLVNEEQESVIQENSTSVQKMFIPMMIITASSVAFAHGSNDIGKKNLKLKLIKN